MGIIECVELGQGSHRVKGRKDMDLLLEHIQELLRHDRLLEDNLVHELREPCITHGEVSLVASNITPAVFNPPANRLAVLIQMNACKDHGVGHQGLAVDQALCFGHVEFDVESHIVLEYFGIQDICRALQVLAYIRTEPDLYQQQKRYLIMSDDGST